MRQEGADIINLGPGSPDMAPPAAVRDELARHALSDEGHGYQEYRGLPALRRAFSQWYGRYFGITPDPATELLPVMGSKEGIMHVTMAFIDPGDEVLVPDPGYPAYAAAALMAGGVVRRYPLTAAGRWLPDLHTLEAEGLERVKLMWVNYPHMPTGARADRELFEELVRFAGRHHLLLCNDNPYSFILNEKHLSLLSVPGAYETALELNSLSKSHNMAGWRIGMLAGNSVYINSVLKVMSNANSGMFRPLQSAAIVALESSDEWYGQLNTLYRRRRMKAGELMNALSCHCESDQAGLFLWGRIPDCYSDAIEMSDELLYRNHLFVTPGTIFGENGRRYIRMALCAGEEAFEKALQRVGADVIRE